jgi:hypothetical protein
VFAAWLLVHPEPSLRGHAPEVVLVLLVAAMVIDGATWLLLAVALGLDHGSGTVGVAFDALSRAVPVRADVEHRMPRRQMTTMSSARFLSCLTA